MPFKAHHFLILLCLSEFLLLGFFRSLLGPYVTPFVFAAISLGIGVFALFKSFTVPNKVPLVKRNIKKGLTSFPVLILGIVLMLYIAWQAFSRFPVDHNYSDVYAQVLFPAQWLLHGEYPYQDVVLPTYTMHNTYLPMQWLPFTLSEIFGFDPRWIPISFWLFALSLFYIIYQIVYTKRNFIAYVLTYIVIVVGVIGYISKNPQEYAATLEFLPAAYYILLFMSLMNGSWLGIGVFLGFCLLSRFSIALFVPFLIVYVWINYGQAFFFKSALTTLGVILLLFVVPFMSQDSSLPKKIIANYDNGAAGEWRVHDWQNPGDLPYQLSRGTGLALYFRDAYPDDLLKGVKILKRWGIAMSVLTGIILLAFLIIFSKKINKDWFLLGSLKIYFTVFYTWVLIPYTYLYILPMSVSVVILLVSYKYYFDPSMTREQKLPGGLFSS